MNTVESTTAAISKLPPDQVAQIRVWPAEQAEAEWDAEINADAMAGKRWRANCPDSSQVTFT